MEAAETEYDYEEELFDVEEISNIVKYSIETTLGTFDYNNVKVSKKKCSKLIF